MPVIPSLKRLLLAAGSLLVLVACSTTTDSADRSSTSTKPAVTQHQTAPPASGGSVPGSTVAPDRLVYVATRTIKYGEPGDGLVASGAIAANALPAGQVRPALAIREADELAAKLAVAEIAPGTIVLSGMFVDPCRAEPCGSIPRAGADE